MGQRAISFPRILSRSGNNRQEQIGGETGYAEGATTWLNADGVTIPSLVTLTSQLLVPVVTDGVLACGFVTTKYNSQSAVVNPPYAIRANRHFPFSLLGMRFLMQVGTISSNALALATDVAAASLIGNSYAIARPTSGAYQKIQFVDIGDTTNTLVTVIDVPAKVDGVVNLGEYNGFVVVEVIPSKIQNVQ